MHTHKFILYKGKFSNDLSTFLICFYIDFYLFCITITHIVDDVWKIIVDYKYFVDLIELFTKYTTVYIVIGERANIMIYPQLLTTKFLKFLKLWKTHINID